MDIDMYDRRFRDARKMGDLPFFLGNGDRHGADRRFSVFGGGGG
jgi:hypothetical protein